MSTDPAQEIEALRAQVRELQDQKSVTTVRVEGFNGLEELSQAIDRNDLAGFIQDRAQPAWLQWVMIAIFALIVLGLSFVLLRNLPG